MAGRSWLVDSNRIASKIKSASGLCDPERVTWKSNPTRACPNCQNVIDNSDDLFHPYLDLDIPKLIQHPGMLSKHRNVAHEWPGLPRGVKFDPSDQEIIWHLLAKVGIENFEPHPFIDEFIPTVDEDDGICYTHPQKLPGVKQDGTVSHFFHRAINAYNTGTRKRRKIQGDDTGDVRWHKTGRTKPVILDGVQRGCKKIMVLYLSLTKGGKSEKTNWVMHQYHLGTGEDEKDREYVISKIFYQQQQPKQGDKNESEYAESADGIITKADPVTPNPVIPNPPRTERQCSELNLGHDSTIYMNPVAQHHENVYYEDEAQHEFEDHNHDIEPMAENHVDQMTDGNDNHIDQMIDGNDNNIDQTIDSNNNNADEDPKWWDSESQYLLDSQQLVEALSLCDDLLHSQSPTRDGNRDDRILENKPSLSDYAHLGPDALKKDLEACQNLVIDPANIELDTPPDFRLSQLDFGSQESFIAWGGGKVGD